MYFVTQIISWNVLPIIIIVCSYVNLYKDETSTKCCRVQEKQVVYISIDFKVILYQNPKFETEQFFKKICKILQGFG